MNRTRGWKWKGMAALVAGGVAACTSGCASLIQGTHQTLDLKTQPPGTQLTLYQWNGEVVAGPVTTPVSAKVHRPNWQKPYLAVASKEGYCPRYWVPDESPSGIGVTEMVLHGVASIFVFPVIITAPAVLVDTADGAAFALDEDEFNNIALQEGPCGQ